MVVERGDYMARVHIENDIYMTVEHLNVTLEKRTVFKSGDKAGQENFTPFAWYSTVKGAAKGLLRLKLAESTATTLKELVADMERIEAHIDAFIKY